MNDQQYILQIYRLHSGSLPAVERIKRAREALNLRHRFSWVTMERRPVLTGNYF
jgi:hypothetical protein